MSRFKPDFLASIVVFLVAVPLSLGIAVASGIPPERGLVAAAIGGVLVGLLGGAPLQVAGPAAGLAAMCFTMIQQHGLESFGAIVALAGVVQLLMAVVGAHRAALAIPPPVVRGMLVGIGVLLFLSQLHVAMGAKPGGSGPKNLALLASTVPQASWPAVIVAAVTVLVLLGWSKLPWKRVQQAVPGPLVAVVLGSAVGALFGARVAKIDLPDVLHHAISPLRPGSVSWGALVVPAIVLAVVASAETLLSAIATDDLHTGERAKLRKELFAQGVANALSGALGALPVTGVIVRTVANIEAGAKSRLSAILHGVWVLAAVALVPWLLELVPVAALAGLLLVTAYRLVAPSKLLAAWRASRVDAVVLFATTAGVVGLDLLKGIGIGVGLSVFLLLVRLVRERSRTLRLSAEVSSSDERHQVRLHGAATFFAVPKLDAVLAELPAKGHVTIDGTGVGFVDRAAQATVASFRAAYERRGGTVEVTGPLAPTSDLGALAH